MPVERGTNNRGSTVLAVTAGGDLTCHGNVFFAISVATQFRVAMLSRRILEKLLFQYLHAQ